MAAGAEATSAAAQDRAINTIDAGPARLPKKSSDSPAPEQESAKRAKRDKKR